MAISKDQAALSFVTSPRGAQTHESQYASAPVAGNAGADWRLATYQEQRGMLFGIAYRMLGSVADAEDLLQETFVRWQQSPQTDIDSPRAFLVTILTRLCINHLESARVRREQYYGQWLPEPLLEEHAAAVDLEVDESLSLAFLVLLERLTPAERAVLLLRDVLDYDYPDIGRILGRSEANCRQLLRRARQHLAAGRPRFEVSHEQQERLMAEFRRYVSAGDVEGLIALLAGDVVLRSDGGGKAPALPVRILGADKVARALIKGNRKFVPSNLTISLAQVNGQLGLVTYRPDGCPFSVLTLDVADGRIQALYIITNPEKLQHLAAARSGLSQIAPLSCP